MKIISDIESLFWKERNSVITLGDFDGFHAGHRKLIETTLSYAAENDLSPILVTYDPSPKSVLRKRRFDEQIYTKEEKISLLQEYGFDAVVFIPFDDTFVRMSARRFLHEILLHHLQAKHIIIGYDHHFGYNRRGNYTYLSGAAQRYDFSVEQIKPFILKHETVSSSLIRQLLRAGEVCKANEFLASPFFLIGTVIHGQQRGKKLGIPTANLHVMPEKILPREGVYMGRIAIGSRIKNAVVNVGFNPTFSNIDLSVEAHILDFDEDIYGQTVKLEILRRIRDERKFESVDELIAQIHSDIEVALKLNR